MPKRQAFPAANTRHRLNAVPMLADRLRRWSNNGSALGRCLVFAGLAAGTDCGMFSGLVGGGGGGDRVHAPGN